MREGTPWLKWLELVGARRLQQESDAAVKAYLAQVDGFLPLEGKSRAWLSHETHRDLETQVLRKLVEQMKDLTAAELAALGRSFNSDNFEIDEPMAAALRRMMTDQGPTESALAIEARTNRSDSGLASSGYSGKPYGGEAHPIPGIIQAEDYDIAPGGVDGITFHYDGPARNGNLRATGDAIALAKFGQGHVSTRGQPEDPDQVYIGWTQTGQWMKYSVHVKEPATYRLGGHFAAGGNDATLSVSFTPELKTGPLMIPTTAGYQPGVEVYHVWETLDNLAKIKLDAGDYVMIVKIENAGGMNLDYLSFTKEP
jgi:hypothetical protein